MTHPSLTRRASDLRGRLGLATHHGALDRLDVNRPVEGLAHALVLERVLALDVRLRQFSRLLVEAEEHHAGLRPFENAQTRSEEHTSELQSLMRLSYAVFCLKKKKTHHSNRT